MKLQFKYLIGVLVLQLFVTLGATSLVRADDAAAKPAAMPQVGLLVVKSLDAAASFVKQTGLDVPPPLDAATLEKQFPFIGQGGLDTTRPIGIIVCGGPNLGFEQMMAFAFPMKPTGGTMDTLKALGGQAMADHPDTVLINGVGLRRTVDYLIFSPNPAVATSVDPESLVAAVKAPEVMAKLSIDFKAFRAVMPDQYKAMLKSLEDSATKDATNANDRANSMMFMTPILKSFDTIDRLDTAVESGEKGVGVTISATPLKVELGAAGATLPGMPADVFARFDANIGASDSTAGIRAQLQKDFNQGATADAKLTAEQKKEVQDLGNQLGELMFDPATTSAGVGMSGTDPVLYLVQHWAKPKDVIAELQQIVKQGNALAAAGDDGVKTETSSADGLTLLRMTSNSSKPSQVEIDVAQRDSDVYITVSHSDKHLVEVLAVAQSPGPMKGILSGWIDLGKSLEAAEKFPGSPLSSLPAEMQKQLGDVLNGQKISITTSADGDTGTLHLAVSKGVMENLPKLIQMLGGAAGPAPEAK